MKILKVVLAFLIISILIIGCGSGGGNPEPQPVKETTVSGTVLDGNGNPIQGAKVTITSTPVTVDTDNSGHFSATVEVGDHHISIKVGTEEIYSNDFSCSEEPYLFTAIPTQYNPNATYPDADGDGHYSNLDCNDNNDNVYPGATEICDGTDNNCDESIDEGCDCTNGSTRTCGSNTGECSTGTETCVNGQWNSCSGEVGPVTEICDGTDNNCDGSTDEGCDCTNGSTRTCGSNTGECSTGTQTCENGQWNSCSGEVGPVTEICDGTDNNCDGSTDEGCDCTNGSTRTCGSNTGECSTGTETCVNGQWNSCSGEVGPVTEICDDEIDQDCNGSDLTCTTYNIWNVNRSLSSPRSQLASAAVNGKIYAIGGRTNSGYLSKNEEYDPVSDTWTPRANMPTPRLRLGTAAVNGKIYAIGGRTNSGYLSKNEEYDPVSDTWTQRADIPSPRQDLAVAVVNGKIYAIGGNSWDNGEVFFTTNEEYDPATDTWTTKAPLPIPRTRLGAAAVNGKIYVIGGWNKTNSYISTVEEYDPITDTWTAKGDMPLPRSKHGVVAVNDKIYAVGGQISGTILTTNDEYDPTNNNWVKRESLPTPLHLFAVSALNGKIYVTGGEDIHLGDAKAINLEYDSEGSGGSTALGYITDNRHVSGEIDITITSTDFACGPDELKTHTRTVLLDETTMIWTDAEMTWIRNPGDPNDIRGSWTLLADEVTSILVISNDNSSSVYPFIWAGTIDCDSYGYEVLELMSTSDVNDDGNWYLKTINTITGETSLVNTSPFLQGGELVGEGTAVDIDEDLAYITGEDANFLNGIFVIDLKTGLLLRTLHLDFIADTDDEDYCEIIFLNSANELMGSCSKDGKEYLMKINTNTGATTIISELSFGGFSGEATAINTKEDIAYTIESDTNDLDSIFVIDLSTGSLMRTVNVDFMTDAGDEDWIETIFFNSAGELMGLSVKNFLWNLRKFNTTTGTTTLINTFPQVQELNADASAIDINADIAYIDGDGIYVIDLNTGELLRTLNISAGETIFFHNK